MSLLPRFKATLEDNLSDKQRDEVVDQLNALKGVISVAFNRPSDKDALVVYTGAGPVEEARKIPGVKSTVYLPRL